MKKPKQNQNKYPTSENTVPLDTIRQTKNTNSEYTTIESNISILNIAFINFTDVPLYYILNIKQLQLPTKQSHLQKATKGIYKKVIHKNITKGKTSCQFLKQYSKPFTTVFGATSLPSPSPAEALWEYPS